MTIFDFNWKRLIERFSLIPHSRHGIKRQINLRNYMTNDSFEYGKKGNKSMGERKGFAAVPHEMIDWLMNPPINITSEETRVIWFLIGQLQGWHFVERAIRTRDLCKGTGLQRQNLTYAVKRLLEKQIICRRNGVNNIYGEHIYSFNEPTFGCIHATNVIHIDKKCRQKSVIHPITPV